MTARHVTLGGGTRLVFVVAALGIAALLYTIKFDLGAIGASLASRPHPGEVTINTREASMISITKKWVSGGQQLSITTTLGQGYLPGETIPGEITTAWSQRHRDKVAEIQALFPPD